ncbi:hypothetical protein BX661DRAFT_189745 [Kickxella alabastrina]|uniref:uncharacterized protein n=1 Tax=Kickxella alabastrina TaxID=61397 RepID=UPI00221E4CAE|nr:uncharacterized protein BX661DRAFT_189745 [Kickxella alabastrina]KAI7819749.1 hypothetical protein BX661DRAFT_189745 [Kickxella alabastrina]
MKNEADNMQTDFATPGFTIDTLQNNLKYYHTKAATLKRNLESTRTETDTVQKDINSTRAETDTL